MKELHNFDTNGIYTFSQDPFIDEKESEIKGEIVYIIPENSNMVDKIPYNERYEYLWFNKDLEIWKKMFIKIKGEFWDINTGLKLDEILLKDQDLYTTIKPKDVYNCKETTQQFVNGKWNIIKSGSTYINKLKENELIEKRNIFVEKLTDKFNKTKNIFLQNGISLQISNKTKERKFFNKNLEELLKIEVDSESFVLGYHQIINNKLYYFDLYSYIWRFIFNDLFIVKYNKKVIKRRINKRIFDESLLKMKFNKDVDKFVEILDSTNFINPDGFIIDINSKVDLLIKDPKTPDYVKSEILDLKEKSDNGKVHLIKMKEI